MAFELLIDSITSGRFGVYDTLVIVIIGLSAIPGLIRGFMREALSALSWIGAIVITAFVYPIAVTRAEEFLDPTLAKVLGPVFLFLATLTVLMIVTIVISKFILKSQIGMIDRVLGIIFGLLRGIILVAVALMLYVWWLKADVVSPKSLVPLDKSETILEDLALLPFLQEVSEAIYVIIIEGASSDNIQNTVKQATDSAVDEASKVGDSLSNSLNKSSDN